MALDLVGECTAQGIRIKSVLFFRVNFQKYKHGFGSRVLGRFVGTGLILVIGDGINMD